MMVDNGNFFELLKLMHLDAQLDDGGVINRPYTHKLFNGPPYFLTLATMFKV